MAPRITATYRLRWAALLPPQEAKINATRGLPAGELMRTPAG